MTDNDDLNSPNICHEHMENIMTMIQNMKRGTIIHVNSLPTDDDSECQLKCSIQKLDYMIFKGCGSKDIAKYYMKKSGDKYLVQLYDENGYRRYVPIANWRTFWLSSKYERVGKRYMFEMILSHKPCKPYFDIEWESDNAQTRDYSKVINTLCNDLIDIFDKRYNIDLDLDDIKISSSHKTNKASFHITIHKIIDNKIVMFDTNKKGFRNSAWDLWGAMIEKRKNYKKILDGAVYTRDREMRTIFSNKNDDFRPFIPYCHNENITSETLLDKNDTLKWLKYLVTYMPTIHYHSIKTPKNDHYAQYCQNRNYDNLIPQIYSDSKINKIHNLAKSVHPTSQFTGISDNGGYRFTYADKNEQCYTGYYHDSNGFYVYETKYDIYMKCMSESCRNKKYVLDRKPIITERLF